MDIEEAWNLLESAGALLLYSSEDLESGKEIYGELANGMDLDSLKKKLLFIQAAFPADLPKIDWTNQWEQHGLNYFDGYVHIDLQEFGQTEKTPIIRLEPGPGFGDLSHPTTNLVLKLMSKVVADQYVLDVGSGSGVLALCAVAMGAKEVFGIDIDREAIAHAKSNAVLNNMEGKVAFSLPEILSLPQQSKSLVVLMNMVWSEQIVAWNSLKIIHKIPGDCLVSGILAEERDDYLKYAEDLGWQFKGVVESDGWLGFHFFRKGSNGT